MHISVLPNRGNRGEETTLEADIYTTFSKNISLNCWLKTFLIRF